MSIKRYEIKYEKKKKKNSVVSNVIYMYNTRLELT